ncbi:MAG: TolC family protein [Acidiferrobacteraceae bacterium]
MTSVGPADNGRGMMWWPLVCFACLMATSATAQTLDPRQAVAYALAHNPSLRAQKALAAASRERIAVARSAGRPRLTAGLGYGLSDDPLAGLTDLLETRSVTAGSFSPPLLNNPGTRHLSTTSIALTFPLYAGGGIDAGIAAARARAAWRHDELKRAREQVAAETLTAYYGVEATIQGVRIAKAAVAAAQRHVQTTRRLLQEARIVRSDWLTAQVNLAAMQGFAAKAQAAAASARSELRLAMGLPSGVPLTLTPVSLPSLPAATRPLIQRAVRDRPDLKGIVRQWRAARDQVTIARATLRPHLGISAANNWYGSAPGFANRSWTVMATVREALYDGGAASARASAASEQMQALAFERRALAARIRSEVRQAIVTMREAAVRLALARRRVERARHAVLLVRRRYGEGRTVLLDLLQSEQNLTKARIERERARYALLRGDTLLKLAEGGPLP